MTIAKRSARRPIADQMYDVLMRQLLDGERMAGETLNIGALTRELNVSQTPLREALARLEHTGLVYREALKGYRVANPLSDREVDKLFEARSVLEPALAYEAALRTTPEFLEELRGTVDELADASTHADEETDSFRHYWHSDAEFHRLIAAQSDNPFLEHSYLALTGHMQRFRLFTKRGRTGAAAAAREHRVVLDALQKSDPDGAREQMRQHLLDARARLLS
ncbi:DNA-binding GntR family transcriptional regulator [Streptomyces sp. Amel2xB2]|nr:MULTISPECIES: GntR family transcriptional regulator [Streptomyces]RAJ71231.1 DNA-binding GntR family transcriptional regulator [Streptomyces sp. Amel2xB2]